MRRFDPSVPCAAVLGLACLFLLSGAGHAQLPSSEEVRLRVLDSCVYAEWQRPEGRDTAAERCQCAARRLAAGLTPQEVAEFARRNRLPRSAQPKWSEAMQTCS